MAHNHGSLIDRDRYVFVAIDIQERLAAVMADRDRVVRAASALARTAALTGAPIIVTRQYPRGLGSTVPEFEEVLVDLAEEGAKLLGTDKVSFSCASEPEFLEMLRATGRVQVVLAGMETHICVVQTALALTNMGFDVHVVADACCSRESAAHDVALDRLRVAGVSVTWSESVMYEVVGAAGTDEFKRLLDIVKA